MLTQRWMWVVLWALLAGAGAYRLGTAIDPDGSRVWTKDGGTVGTNGGACIDPDGAMCPKPPAGILGGGH